MSSNHSEQRLVGEMIRALNELSRIGRRSADDLEQVRQDLERCGYLVQHNRGAIGQPTLTLVGRKN